VSLRPALRAATPIPIPEQTIVDCLDLDSQSDALFDEARRCGLASISRDRRGGLNRVTGEVAESVAELMLADADVTVFWHITTPGIHGVDLLFLCPDESVLALEVKGTLRPGAIPRITPSRLRQMSREWLNGPDNPAMAEWQLKADDLYAGVVIIDLAQLTARLAVSGDFESFIPAPALDALQHLSRLCS
jgi:hypothetical protein